MGLLYELSHYVESFSTEEACGYFGSEIINIANYYEAGEFDTVTTLLESLCTEINNYAGGNLITDFSVNEEGCFVELYDGAIINAV